MLLKVFVLVCGLHVATVRCLFRKAFFSFFFLFPFFPKLDFFQNFQLYFCRFFWICRTICERLNEESNNEPELFSKPELSAHLATTFSHFESPETLLLIRFRAEPVS